MQTDCFYINESLASHSWIEAVLSFNPFVNHLEKLLHASGDSIKAKFYSFVLEHFKIDRQLNGLAANHVHKENNEYALELIYSTLSPVLRGEDDYFWALSTPVPNQILYSTDAFYRLINANAEHSTTPSIITDEGMLRRQQLGYIYRFILKRLYDFTSVLSSNVYYTYTNPSTGLCKYYQIHIDTTFIDIKVNGHLPELDFETIENYLQDDGGGVEVLAGVLPLHMFKLEGFSVITLQDVTQRRAIEDIREAISNPENDQKELYKSVISSLKILTENNNVSFGLLPFLKLNNEPLFDMASCSQSILIQSAVKYNIAEEAYNALVQKYEAEPKAVFFNYISESQQQKTIFLKALRNAGIKSYAVLPVFYNNRIAGILEVYSEKELVFYENLLSRLEFALPLIAQLLQNSIEHFNTCIDEVIKERFTSLQPAVQWKFNETAWQYIKNQKGRGRKPRLGNIKFNDVFPLYGAVDIRNSTLERNLALQQDFMRVIKLLRHILLELNRQYPGGGKWQALADKCDEWLHIIDNGVNTADEILITGFLENEAGEALTAFSQHNPDATALVDRYLEMIGSNYEGSAFTQRNRLETSMQMINRSLNNYFEQAQYQLQRIYPCYFEKFRTDGVEYDIYVGQAIAPKQRFDVTCLRQMRLWQLTSMVDVARLTHNLLQHMPAALQTTQLIFIHSMSIDISFRNDERRFDVEGAYNIRYEVIKKRIDKVTLLNSSERLTQPGKIAIVYFNQTEHDEQLEYIKQLQQQNMLLPNVENLELEELQGVVGLRALRVSINFNGA